MSKVSRRMRENKEKVVEDKLYELKEGMLLVKEIANTKFDETVDMVVNLGVDPKHADQMVRGAVLLRNGLGKKVRVLAFAKGEQEKEALDAGADYVGAADLVSKISGGWMEFDRVVATPDMMGVVAKLGRILGPRGLMPNPKVGTVTTNLAKLIPQIKKGQIEYRVDKNGIIHAPIGKVSFGIEKLYENAIDLLESLKKAKPSTSKGKYLMDIAISSSMGPCVNINVLGVEKIL